MHYLLKIAEWIDRLNERMGRFASWLVLVIVLLGAWNAIARYTGRFTGMNLASNVYLELQWHLFGALFLLGLGYTLKHDEHVRVDVLHAAIKPRVIARIDIIGTLVFLLPFAGFLVWSSWFPAQYAWEIKEMSPDAGGIARYPIKMLIPVAFALLFLQGISMLIRRWKFIRDHANRATQPVKRPHITRSDA